MRGSNPGSARSLCGSLDDTPPERSIADRSLNSAPDRSTLGRRTCYAAVAGRRERPQRDHSHAAKPSAAIARTSRIHSTGVAALVLRTCPPGPDGTIELGGDSR